MEDKIVHKFIAKVKDKLSKNKTTYPSVNEYAFSNEEIESIVKQNKQKIQELKEDTFLKKKDSDDKKTLLEQESFSPIEGKTTIEAGLNKDMLKGYQEEMNDSTVVAKVLKQQGENDEVLELSQEKDEVLELRQKNDGVLELRQENNEALELRQKNNEILKLSQEKDEVLELRQKNNEVLEVSQKNNEILKKQETEKVLSISENKSESEELEQFESEGVQEEILVSQTAPKNSFIHLNEEYQNIVMSKWNEIDLRQIDKDIMEGKDLLNHNYTITYADESAKFIHDIRKRYEVVICYLIGFNNEKKGIFDKTIFSDKIEQEWKYLSNYIKVLEKIRSFRK